MFLLTIFSLLLTSSSQLNQNCSDNLTISLDKNYFISNSEYPGKYGPNTTCKWTIQSAPNTLIQISCDFDLPSMDCHGDHFVTSLSGKDDVQDNNTSCDFGKGAFTKTSIGNRLVIGFFSGGGSTGGNFLCSIKAEIDEKTSTTSPETCDCGWTLRDKGVEENEINQFPSMSALVDTKKETIICGASIISKKFVLTAAQCVYEKNVTEIQLLAGTDSNQNNSHSTTHKLSWIAIHPNYDHEEKNNDIALVRFVSEIGYSVFVGPSCLPFKYTDVDFVETNAHALGWSKLQGSSEIILKVDVEIISEEECGNFRDNVQFNQICSKRLNKDSCKIRPGGEFLWKDPFTTRYQVIGINSVDSGCDSGLPIVTTRVTSYLNWILFVTNETKYC